MKPSDLSVILNGLEIVARAFIKVQEKEFDKFWRNSSLSTISKSVVTSAEETISSVISSSNKGNVSFKICNNYLINFSFILSFKNSL